MKKPLIVVFEGQDKVGKTTLVNEFNKASGFSHLVLDRLTTSSFVYTEAFNRGPNVMEHFKKVHEAFRDNFTVVQVLLVSNEVDILKRLHDAGEMLPKELSDIDKIQNKFLKFSKESGFNLVIINTSEKTIDEAVDIVVDSVCAIMEEGVGRCQS